MAVCLAIVRIPKRNVTIAVVCTYSDDTLVVSVTAASREVELSNELLCLPVDCERKGEFCTIRSIVSIYYVNDSWLVFTARLATAGRLEVVNAEFYRDYRLAPTYLC